MARVVATRSAGNVTGVLRGVVLVFLPVAAVIVGLLGMHTLNLHGTTAADTPTTLSTPAAEVVTAPHTATHSTATHSTGAQPAGTHHASAEASLPAGNGGSPASSCAGCGTDDHSGMAMTCVLALLLLLLLLAPPRILRGSTATASGIAIAPVLTALRLPHAPSLHVLCISRT